MEFLENLKKEIVMDREDASFNDGIDAAIKAFDLIQKTNLNKDTFLLKTQTETLHKVIDIGFAKLLKNYIIPSELEDDFFDVIYNGSSLEDLTSRYPEVFGL